MIRPVGRNIDVTTTLMLAGDLRVWTVAARSAYELEPNSPSRYWVCLPVRGSVEGIFGQTTHTATSESGWIRDIGTLDQLRVAPGLRETSFDLPCRLVRDYLSRAHDYESVPNISIERPLNMSTGIIPLISTLIRELIASAGDGTSLLFSPFAAQNFSDLVLDLLVHNTFLEPVSRARTADSSAVHRAVDFIEANLQRSLTIMDIAEAAGVGPRALQVGFQRRFACSPLRYMRVQRLARVRESLARRAHHENIAEIAARWGFFHLGLFARQYREVYHELPSETKHP
jgi:AraC-like DNA-binding protein